MAPALVPMITVLVACSIVVGSPSEPSPVVDPVCAQANGLLGAIPARETAVAIKGTVSFDIYSRFPDRSPQGRSVLQQGFETTAQVALEEKDPAAWSAAFARYGMQGAWLREWKAPSQLEEVYELADHKDALAFQRWASNFSCRYANLVFSVHGVPGSIGFQIRWASGGDSDQVSFVRGPRRYLVAIPPQVAPTHPNLVVALARTANRKAG